MVQAQPFSRTDSGPGTDGFRERFLASYGVNEAIEPKLGAEDQPLYERIAPMLRESPRMAIREVLDAVEPGEKPAFDFLLGNLYYQTDQLDRAEAALRRAIESFPNFRRAHRTVGLIYIRKERFEDAVDAWLKVITLGGGDGQSYGLLGYAYLARERYESALAAYKMARMFRPESVDFRRGEALCLLRIGEYARAAALFDELVREAPETPDYWRHQANAFLELERDEDAITNLEILRSMGAATAASHRLLGDLYLRQENARLALNRYEDALRTDGPVDFERALRPLDNLMGQRLFEEAERYLSVLRDSLPDDLSEENASRIDVAVAGLALERGKVNEARQRLESVVEAQPLNGRALLLLGKTLERAGQQEEAAFYLERALSVPGMEIRARTELGRLEVARGNYGAALEHLRSAYEQEPRPGLQRYIEAVESAR